MPQYCAGFMKINTDFNRQRVSVCFRKMNNSQNTFVFFILLPESLQISFACVAKKHAHCSALLFCLCAAHLSQLAIRVIEIYYCNVYILCPLKSSKIWVHEDTVEYVFGFGYRMSVLRPSFVIQMLARVLITVTSRFQCCWILIQLPWRHVRV